MKVYAWILIVAACATCSGCEKLQEATGSGAPENSINPPPQAFEAPASLAETPRQARVFRVPAATILNTHSFVAQLDAARTIDLAFEVPGTCLLYTSPSPRDGLLSRMPSSA